MKSHNIFHVNTRAGFTLLEILVVMGLFALLASVGAIMAFDSVTRSTVQNERDVVVLMLTGARTRALANMNESAHGVRIEPSQIVVYELFHGSGSELNVRSTPRNTAVLSSPSNANIVFSQLSAKVSTGVGSLTLTDSSKTAVIEVDGNGRIEW